MSTALKCVIGGEQKVQNVQSNRSAQVRPSLAGLPALVQVQRDRADGFVEFTFSLGDPDTGVELILPVAAFAEFCTAQNATVIPAASAPLQLV